MNEVLASFPPDGLVVEVRPLTRRQRVVRRCVAGFLLVVFVGPLVPVIVLVTQSIAREGWTPPTRPLSAIALIVLWVAIVVFGGLIVMRLVRRDRDRMLEITPGGLHWRWRGQEGNARWDEIRDIELASPNIAHRTAPVLCITPHEDTPASTWRGGTRERFAYRQHGSIPLDLMHMTDIDVAAAIQHYSGRTVPTR